jgi:hypothetical protein
MGIKEAIRAENERGRAIMKTAMKARQESLGLIFLGNGLPALQFARACASLQGKPGTFGHMVGIGPDRSAEDISASLSLARAGQSARELAAEIIAAGGKAGLGASSMSRA